MYTDIWGQTLYLFIPRLLLSYLVTLFFIYRHCLLGSACDMFVLDQTSKKCYMMPHNRLKNAQNPNQLIEQSGSPDTHMYILQCTTSQENILKNNEAFTNTLSGITK